jgi:hypothetical protein
MGVKEEVREGVRARRVKTVLIIFEFREGSFYYTFVFITLH